MEVKNFVIGDASYDGIPSALYSKEVLTHGLIFERSYTIKTESVAVKFDSVVYSRRSNYGRIDDVGYVGESLVKLYFDPSGEKKAYFYVSGADLSNIEATKPIIERWCSPLEKKDEFVYVNFWSLGQQGPRNHQRKIKVPSWSEMEHNYSLPVRKEFGRVINREFDSTEGKLILWYGPPGSGKSFAIRAVMREWKKTTFDYIVDPERFFGTNPDYMLDVLLNDSKLAKLVVLEDTGELLSADAKSRSGQGLSRLLNVADGLIGQGIELTILLTTNEELGSFHPAVVRPGRCISKVEVGPLSIQESSRWLRERGCSARVSEPKSLAELYAILNNTGDYSAEEPVAIGQYI